MHSLDELGFYPFFSSQFDLLDQKASLVPARISLDGGGTYQLLGCRAPSGELSGRLRQELKGHLRPTTGDWVLADDDPEHAVIHHVFDRKTSLLRRMADSDDKLQVIAVNVDVYFIVTSANQDFNVRRLERYLTLVADSGAQAVIVLNKVDLVDSIEPFLQDVAGVSLGTEVVPVSAHSGTGVDGLRSHLRPGITIGLVGSSGVGKSSITNRLLGDAQQATREIRGDGKGRHTTTSRQLVVLPSGGVLLDTPGMREIGVTQAEVGLDEAFADVLELSGRCRFTDCQHEGEPGCAVQAAVDSGELSGERVDGYFRLRREAAAMAIRVDAAAASAARKKWKQVAKRIRAMSKVTPKMGR